MINYKEIRKIREDKKISQKEIAEKIRISRSSYIIFEKGEKELTLSELEKLTEILGIKIIDFLEEKKNIEKYKQMLFYFLELNRKNCETDLVKTKLAKLLYLSDFAWYYNTYESMSGMTYRNMNEGPVPNDYFSVLEELRDRKLINIKFGTIAHFITETEAGKNIKSNLISEKEKKLMKKIFKKWKDKTKDDIVGYTHNQLPFLFSKFLEDIPYELIIQEDPENVY